MADRERVRRCRRVELVAREAVVALLLKERLHSRVGCFERTALHVGPARGNATICPQARDEGVVLPHGHRAGGRQLR